MSKTKLFAILGALITGGIPVVVGLGTSAVEAGHQLN